MPKRRSRVPVRSKARRKRGSFLPIAALVLIGGIAFVIGMIAVYAQGLPNVAIMGTLKPASATRIYARDGSLLASVYKTNRVYVPLSRIPPYVREAFIANEDRSFYYNPGIDIGGIIRAAFADLTHTGFQGASTITQQLARNLFLSDRITIKRKIQEAILAIELERYYTKNQILEHYLNLIYLGAGAYGVDAAAHTYFGRDVDHVTLAQAAMLAGVVAAPSDYSPFVDLRLARERQAHVLQRMVDTGYISVAKMRAALKAPLGLTKYRQPGVLGFRDPWFTTYALARLERLFGAQAVREGGLRVYTTVDPKLERLAQQAVDWGVKAAQAEGINAHQGALVAIRPSTGEIVAMIGGTTFSITNQFNRAWQALRQPGSSFKAYVYTAAIDSGLLPSTLMDDSPITYAAGDGTMWSPHDDDLRFMGEITLRRALALSRNVVAVKVADRVGIDRVIAYAHQMGVRAPLEADLSLALGTSGVSVLDQATGYATLADQGVHIDPVAVRLVEDANGNRVLDRTVAQETRVVSRGTAYLVTSMLQDVIAYGTGTNANIGRPEAGKTGTTSDFRDAWFVGYTPDLVTAVWLGNDDFSRMHESYGGDIPARIWARFMRAALAHTPPHPFPFPRSEVSRVAGCGGTGHHLYIKDQAPISPCALASPTYDAPATVIVIPTVAPVEPSILPANATQPPNSVGDGSQYLPLAAPASPGTAASAAPSAAPSAVPTPSPSPNASAGIAPTSSPSPAGQR